MFVEELEQQIIACFYREKLIPQPYRNLRAIGGSQTLRIVTELIQAGKILRRDDGRYILMEPRKDSLGRPLTPKKRHWYSDGRDRRSKPMGWASQLKMADPAETINRGEHYHYSLMSRIANGQTNAHQLDLNSQDHICLQRLIDYGLVQVVSRHPNQYWADSNRLGEAKKLDKQFSERRAA